MIMTLFHAWEQRTVKVWHSLQQTFLFLVTIYRQVFSVYTESGVSFVYPSIRQFLGLLLLCDECHTKCILCSVVLVVVPLTRARTPPCNVWQSSFNFFFCFFISWRLWAAHAYMYGNLMDIGWLMSHDGPTFSSFPEAPFTTQAV